jgi:hypothetical protein
MKKLKLLAASCEESSIPKYEFYILCSLTPWQATGNALAGIQQINKSINQQINK